MRGRNRQIEATVGPTARAWRRGAQALGRADSATLARIALALLLAGTAAFLFHETRGTTLWFDEWDWALNRRANDLDTFLRPHNEHLSVVPVAIYKLLFATAGLSDYVPYRAAVIGAHLVCVVLLFVYASRRVGNLLALLAAVSILLLGPAWQNFIWPFQIGWLIPLAAGLGALLMLDRRDRAGDVAACALIALALASSGLGLVIAIGVIVELLSSRRGRRDAWIVAAPLAVYALWWLFYQDASFVRHNVVVTPGFAADAAAGAMSALAGLAGGPIGDTTVTLAWGRPLALAAAAVLAWRLVRLGRIPPRVLTLLSMLLAFWVLTALRRAQISSPAEGRYLYVGGLLVVLLAVELSRGIALSSWTQPLLAGAVAVIAVGNIGDLRDGARYLRTQAQTARAVAGALELSRPVVAPDHLATGFPGYPFVVVRAGPYLAAVDQYGSPASKPAEIAGAIEEARLAADSELARIHDAVPRPVAAQPDLGTRPAVDAVAGGTVAGEGACVAFRPLAAGPAQPASEIQLTVPPGGLLLESGAAPADVSVRRFAATFPAEPQGRLTASATAALRIGRDLATQPWHVRVGSAARLRVCGLRPIP